MHKEIVHVNKSKVYLMTPEKIVFVYLAKYADPCENCCVNNICMFFQILVCLFSNKLND